MSDVDVYSVHNNSHFVWKIPPKCQVFVIAWNIQCKVGWLWRTSLHMKRCNFTESVRSTKYNCYTVYWESIILLACIDSQAWLTPCCIYWSPSCSSNLTVPHFRVGWWNTIDMPRDNMVPRCSTVESTSTTPFCSVWQRCDNCSRDANITYLILDTRFWICLQYTRYCSDCNDIFYMENINIKFSTQMYTIPVSNIFTSSPLTWYKIFTLKYFVAWQFCNVVGNIF